MYILLKRCVIVTKHDRFKKASIFVTVLIVSENKQHLRTQHANICWNSKYDLEKYRDGIMMGVFYSTTVF